ncbi:hypothetical protein ACV3J7_00125 [Salmonella enterica]
MSNELDIQDLEVRLGQTEALLEVLFNRVANENGDKINTQLTGLVWQLVGDIKTTVEAACD